MTAPINTPPRIAKWDNAKAFLMLMVVFGHSILAFLENSIAVKFADLWIYTFHMPLFIFIGGLFSKRTINTKPFKYEKVISYLLLCFFMKVVTYLVTLICRGKASFSLLSENGVAWYIFALAIHLTIAHLLRNCEPWKVLLASTLLALLAGYVDEFGNTLVLSRIFVFFPIFYLGYATDGEKLLKIVNKPVVRILSAVFLILFTVGLYFITDKIYSIRYLLTGNHPYVDFGPDWHLYGAILRLAVYALTFVVSFSVLSVIPNRKLPVVSYCGTKTLQIYALHRPIQLILEYTFLRELLGGVLPRYILPVLFAMSLVFTLLLSTKPFEYLLYPCTKWQKWLCPIMSWFKRKESPDTNK